MYYGFSPEQHAALDAELETMWKRLIEIAVEISQSSSETDRNGFTYQTACRAGDAVGSLRLMLEQAQEHQRMGEGVSQLPEGL